MKPLRLARRDMTRAQFDRALAQRGFARVGLGIMGYYFRDTTGRTTTHFGATVNPKTMTILRRETLANLIQLRKNSK